MGKNAKRTILKTDFPELGKTLHPLCITHKHRNQSLRCNVFAAKAQLQVLIWEGLKDSKSV